MPLWKPPATHDASRQARIGPSEENVVEVDLWDASTQEQLGSKPLKRNDFNQPMNDQTFRLAADMLGRKGHKVEARIWWFGLANVKVDKIIVQGF